MIPLQALLTSSHLTLEVESFSLLLVVPYLFLLRLMSWYKDPLPLQMTIVQTILMVTITKMALMMNKFPTMLTWDSSKLTTAQVTLLLEQLNSYLWIKSRQEPWPITILSKFLKLILLVWPNKYLMTRTCKDSLSSKFPLHSTPPWPSTPQSSSPSRHRLTNNTSPKTSSYPSDCLRLMPPPTRLKFLRLTPLLITLNHNCQLLTLHQSK